MSSNQVEPQGQAQAQAGQSQAQGQPHPHNHSHPQANPSPDHQSIHHQHHQHHHVHPQQAVTQLPSNSNDSYVCQWANCGKRVETPELLYDHVCETHIGRKSTNNLNLVCAWGNCQIQVIKRDHITSHIRVHVPLKPHRCEFCGKAFKRPQDLKKHVKTHAEDTVLVRTADHQNGNRPNQNGHYSVGGQHKPNGYYSDQQQQHSQLQGHPPLGYGHPAPNGSQGYYGPTQQQHSSTYGHVFYPANQGGESGHHANLDVRNQGISTLNNFYYDTQRGHFDPKSYPQVESRLLTIQASQLPFMGTGGLPEYSVAASAMGGGGPQVGVYAPTPQYQLPGLDHLRTKNDLLLVDQVMEQAQATIYDRPNQMAAAGVNQGSQPGTYYVRHGGKYRHSPSPPRTQLSSHYGSGVATSPATVSASHYSGESPPALTPTDSTHSYHSARSPASHSNLSMSPATTATMYPTLPSTSSDAMSTGYFSSNSSMAPTSTLGTQFHDDDYHRMSGGSLRRARPLSRVPKPQKDATKDQKKRGGEEMDTDDDDGIAVVETSRSSRSTSKGEDRATPQPRPRTQVVSDSMIDPALSGGSASVASPSSGELDERDIKENEVWVGIVRTIEGLRAWIRRRIENGEYEGSDGEEERDVKAQEAAEPTVKKEVRDGGDGETGQHDERSGQALYPVLAEVGVES